MPAPTRERHDVAEIGRGVVIRQRRIRAHRHNHVEGVADAAASRTQSNDFADGYPPGHSPPSIVACTRSGNAESAGRKVRVPRSGLGRSRIVLTAVVRVRRYSEISPTTVPIEGSTTSRRLSSFTNLYCLAAGISRMTSREKSCAGVAVGRKSATCTFARFAPVVLGADATLFAISFFCSSVSGNCSAVVGSLSSFALSAEIVDGIVCPVAPGGPLFVPETDDAVFACEGPTAEGFD